MRSLARTAFIIGLPYLLLNCSRPEVPATEDAGGAGDDIVFGDDLVDPNNDPNQADPNARSDASSFVVQNDDFPDATFSYTPPAEDVQPSCASVTSRTTQLPLDIYLMLDRSGSMNIPESLPGTATEDGPPEVAGDCNVGDDPTSSRWCSAINALSGFFAAPESVDTGVALGFFPGDGCSAVYPSGNNCCSSGACCGGSGLVTPVVPLGLIPAQNAALVAALDAEVPRGVNTPIEAALNGLATFSGNNRSVGRNMAAVLITDGDPQGCNESSAALASIATNLLVTEGVPTFVIGMDGAVFSVLEEIAAKGGTVPHTDYCPTGINPCHVYNVGSGDPSTFTAALAQIRQSLVGCHFSMPQSDAGVINPENIEVVYESGDNQTLFTRVESGSACGSGAGFYYDNNSAPTALTLCPSSCAEVQADPAAEITLALGCLGQ